MLLRFRYSHHYYHLNHYNTLLAEAYQLVLILSTSSLFSAHILTPSSYSVSFSIPSITSTSTSKLWILLVAEAGGAAVEGLLANIQQFCTFGSICLKGLSFLYPQFRCSPISLWLTHVWHISYVYMHTFFLHSAEFFCRRIWFLNCCTIAYTVFHRKGEPHPTSPFIPSHITDLLPTKSLWIKWILIAIC